MEQQAKARRDRFLKLFYEADMREDLYGGRALARLAATFDVPAADRKLGEMAAWFSRPLPNGRDPHGECDFIALKLCWAHYGFADEGLLSPGTLAAIREFFLRYDFQSKYTSENHRLIFHTSRYLMAHAYPDDVFGRYGLSGAQLAPLDLAYLTAFLRNRACQGWEEFDSGNYLAPAWECLCALHDFAPDADLRTAATMMLHVRLMDAIADSLEGMHCGAQGRIYERHALDHEKECAYFLQALYFGNVQCTYDRQPPQHFIVEALLSRFVPDPLLARIVALPKPPYESRERARLHCSTYEAPQRPLPQEPGSIRKLTRITPQYGLGCVQWQDPYAPGSAAAWYRGHQQHYWDLTFCGGDTHRRIFTHHPGHNGAEGAEHGYWTGDMLCDCSAHFQHGTAVLSLYKIPAGEPYQCIHAYVPRHLFDEIVEDGSTVFMRSGDVFAMLRFSGAYVWTQSGAWAGVELICEGSRHAVACEVGTAQDYGDLQTFMQAMQGNRLSLEAGWRAVYCSAQNGQLCVSRTERLHDGKAVWLDYATYDSPYMRAEWNSGVVDITDGSTTLHFDFVHNRMRRSGESLSNR